MTSRDFVYWLQGLFEVADPSALNQQQTKMVKEHLALVFQHDVSVTQPPQITVVAEKPVLFHQDAPWNPGQPVC